MFCILLDYLLWLDNPEIIGNFLFVQILYLLVDHLTSSAPVLSSTNAKRIFSGCKLNVWTAGFCLLRTNSVFVWVSHTEDWLTFQQDLSLKNKNFPASCLQPIVKLFTVLQKISSQPGVFYILHITSLSGFQKDAISINKKQPLFLICILILSIWGDFVYLYWLEWLNISHIYFSRD